MSLPVSAEARARFQARDPYAAGLFPVCVATHDVGIRSLFDLATLLLLLDCRPGDRVLDLGAGSGFSSEMLARLGYDVVAVDPDRAALAHNRARPALDSTRIDGVVRVLQGVAEGLPLADRSVDGVLAMNVVHHVPDVPAGVAELARVLKPGCRAVCSEPGLDHLDVGQTQRAVREHGENDHAFDVLMFLRLARERGFSQAMLSATLHSALRLVPLEEVELFRSGQHPRGLLTSGGVLDHLQHRHAFAMLVREGERPKTSRHPGQLRGALQVEGPPPRVGRGVRLTVSATATNTGDSVWLATPTVFGGYVTAGSRLLRDDGRLVTDGLGRTFLPADVKPGESVTVEMSIVIPPDLSVGRYRLQFDLVDELVCWFSHLVSEAPKTYDLEVE